MPKSRVLKTDPEIPRVECFLDHYLGNLGIKDTPINGFGRVESESDHDEIPQEEPMIDQDDDQSHDLLNSSIDTLVPDYDDLYSDEIDPDLESQIKKALSGEFFESKDEFHGDQVDTTLIDYLLELGLISDLSGIENERLHEQMQNHHQKMSCQSTTFTRMNTRTTHYIEDMNDQPKKTKIEFFNDQTK